MQSCGETAAHDPRRFCFSEIAAETQVRDVLWRLLDRGHSQVGFAVEDTALPQTRHAGIMKRISGSGANAPANDPRVCYRDRQARALSRIFRRLTVPLQLGAELGSHVPGCRDLGCESTAGRRQGRRNREPNSTFRWERRGGAERPRSESPPLSVADYSTESCSHKFIHANLLTSAATDFRGSS